MRESFSGFIISAKFHAIVISTACRNSWHKFSGFEYDLRILRLVSNFVLLPCRTQFIELNSTLARQALLCYTAVARLGFRRRPTAVPNSVHKL